MNSNSIMSAIKFGGVAALVLATTTVTFRAQADDRNEETRVTINEPIQVTKTVLNPGTYVFKLATDSQWNRNVVQIYNANETRIIATVIAISDTRPADVAATTGQQFSFYETPAGAVKALHTWFYPGNIDGREFPYPQHLAMLTAKAMPGPAIAAPPAEPEAQAPAPPPQQEQATVETQTQTEVAQNTPPPAPPAAVQTPAAEQPAQLPKTATSFPLFGLGGLLSFAGYGLLRLKRLA